MVKLPSSSFSSIKGYYISVVSVWDLSYILDFNKRMKGLGNNIKGTQIKEIINNQYYKVS